MIAEAVAEDRVAETFEYYADNSESLALFMLLETQWRVVAAMKPVWTGLDYTAVQATMNLVGVRRRRQAQLFADMRVMERAAIPVLNKTKDD